MKSFSEIDTTSKRATKAIGFSWGIAEEVGKNIKLLELFGLPGLKNLNEYFKEYKSKQFQTISLINKINESSKISYCPITLGVNFLDQINLICDLKEIKLKNIAYPLLFLPFVSRASEIIGKRIFLKIDETEFLLNFNQSINLNFLENKVIKNCENIDVIFFENQNTFSDNEWEEIYKLSEDTFVEETDSLKKKGAGAGLTDND
tara:strand:- start:1198 stop:1809 length:612 start_codon:yes stop_codon:yes gene_type:complete